MIHIITINWTSDKWIDIQSSSFKKYITSPYKVYTKLGNMGEDLYEKHKDKYYYCAKGEEGEDQLLNHLPYMNWKQWIHKLNEFKYGIHLMRTHAAATFALNCAYLGIPCIGYKGLDTQELCHPNLTVSIGDLASAKEKLILLQQNQDFYNECSLMSKEKYYTLYNEKNYLKQINEKFKINS